MKKHALLCVFLYNSIQEADMPQGFNNEFGSKDPNALPDDHRKLEPPDPMPNSEVKQFIANGSVGSPHARVGHRQAFNTKNPSHESG